MTGTTRRNFLTLGAMALSAPFVARSAWAQRVPPIKSKSVVFANWGGDTGTAMKEVMFDSFQKEYGVTVATPAASFSKFELMAQSGTAQWDSVDADGFAAVQFIDKGILQPLPDWVTRVDGVPESVRNYLSAGYAYSLALGYSKDSFPSGGPKDWKDFWDLKRFPGRRGLPDYWPAILEAALMADGADKDKLYPLDIDRALKKLDEIRSDVVFFSSYGEGQQLLGQGSVAMVLNTSSRTTLLAQQGLNVEVVWNQAILMNWSAAPVIKNAPNPDAIFALVDWMSDPTRQAEFARRTLTGPTNKAALALMSDKELASLANSPEHTKLAAVVDQIALSKQSATVSQRYTDWLAKK